MLGCAECYSSARLHLARAEDTSGLETDADDQLKRKRKRVLLAFSDESHDEMHEPEKVYLGGKTKKTAPSSGDETAPDNNMSLPQPPVPLDLNFTAALKSVGQFHCVTVCILLI